MFYKFKNVKFGKSRNEGNLLILVPVIETFLNLKSGYVAYKSVKF